MAWFDSRIWESRATSKNTKEGVDYKKLAEVANPNWSGFEGHVQYNITRNFLASAYEEGLQLYFKISNEAVEEYPEWKSKGAQNDEGEYMDDYIERKMFDEVYAQDSVTYSIIDPYGDMERWAIFTDLTGWEIDENVWMGAIREASETSKMYDDRGIIPYEVLTHMIEQILIWTFNNTKKEVRSGLAKNMPDATEYDFAVDEGEEKSRLAFAKEILGEKFSSKTHKIISYDNSYGQIFYRIVER